jgi:hypothetical protein
MNATSSLRLPLCALTAVLSFGLGSHAFAQSVSTTPVGAVTYTIPAYSTRGITVPLTLDAVGQGQLKGKITSVGSNTITNSSAGWQAGALVSAATPYFIRLNSGLAAGRVFMVSTSVANDATTLTVGNDGTDLTTLGIVAGDLYEILPADTLGTLFGANTIAGGDSAAVADNILVWSGSTFLTFYYNTTRGRWERDSDPNTSRDSYVLRPDRGFFVKRNAGTSLTFTFAGAVSPVKFSPVHSKLGTTFLSYGFPVTCTLSSLNLQAQSGWRAWADQSTALANADLVQIWSGSTWLNFYYDSTYSRWQRAADATNTDRNGYSISACVPVVLKRVSSDPNVVLNFSLPYTL